MSYREPINRTPGAARFIIVAGALFASAAFAADLPVKQVILYKHGVGYFERAGALAPGESAQLDFKASEMNDVLKSLTVEDKSGGKVTGIRYDSSEPLDRKLAEFPFHVDGQQGLAAFLDQMKGARLELRLGTEAVAGVILTARTIPGQQNQPEQQRVVLLSDTGELRTIDLAAASALRFSDPRLQAQLRDYLSMLAGAQSREKRSVYIDSANGAARQIALSYMAPAPVWKSSYRLIFDAAGDPTLEGWAIVDNTSGEDWTNVRLSLVSGRPISFISRLYEPRYAERQVAELPEERAQRPVVHGGVIAGAAANELRAMSRMAPPPPPPPPPPAAPRYKAAPAPAGPEMMMDSAGPARERMEVASSVSAAAQGRELGELFEYRFDHPVTVRKSESAMLPFLQQKVSARKLLIYADEGSQHPMNAAEITNSTGKTLDGGPVTVFESNAYGGEALMETLKASDKRLISYGVDLGTRITTQFDSQRDDVREVRLSRGILTASSTAREIKTFTIRNVDAKPKTLVIEQPVRPGYKLVNQKPSETTANAYRLEVKLAAGATEKFPVIEERVYEQTMSLASLTPDFLFTYVRNKALSAAARKQLEAIALVKQQIVEADRALRQTESEIAELSRDQERLRQNIESLNRVSGQQEQVQKYARDLAARESQLAGLRDRQNELRKKKEALEAESRKLIEAAVI